MSSPYFLVSQKRDTPYKVIKGYNLSYKKHGENQLSNDNNQTPLGKSGNKEKLLSKVPASFDIYVLCFPAFMLLLVSLPFKLICLSQFVASSKV